jgi:hypothetical protein
VGKRSASIFTNRKDPTMRVKALQYMYYDKHEYQAGDIYGMDDREEHSAKLLAMLGKIEILPPDAVLEKQQKTEYRTAALEPEPVKEEEAVSAQAERAPQKRTYKRRDMRPEE